jgi:mRNA-degrading endonuclease RelE of RelBE toxin-antitoxin system
MTSPAGWKQRRSDMGYEIEIAIGAVEELKAIKRYYRRAIIDAIEQELTHQPTTETRNRKLLVGLKPDFEHVPPVWEFRVGDYRVFYDVNVEQVRAVREKPPHATTEQIT